jgi:penicillin-binding protein 1C
VNRKLRNCLIMLGVSGAFALGLGVWAVQHAALQAPAPTVWLADVRGAFLAAQPMDADARLGFWPLVDPPHRIVAATLAIEDRDFGDHPGVDVWAVARAVRQNVSAGRRVSGASTIAMQVARMQRPSARDWGAKLSEAAVALALVQRNGHDAVLAHYLRLAPYGNNLHGAGFAARWYFDKPLADLSWAEAAFLAGLPQAPGRMNPYSQTGRARGVARALRVLDALVATEQLDASGLALARTELETMAIRPRPERPGETMHVALRLAAQPGPVDRRATLDLAIQRQAQGAIDAVMTELEDRGAQQAAAMVIDLETMQVRAAIGSRDWRSSALDFTAIHRSPGSVLKPFIFAQALENQVIDQTTILDDLARTKDGIGNADDRFLGPMLPAAALGNSRNVPAVHLVDRLGVGRVFGLFRQLGLHAESTGGTRYGLGLAVGALPTRLVDVMTAYTTLAGDGRLHPLRWMTHEVSAPGRPRGERIFSPSTVRQIAGFLSDPQARLPSFPRSSHSEYAFPVAVKTGTSAAWRDAWTIAYSERFLVGVWVGRPDWRPMRRVSGFRAGARIVKAIMTALHPEERAGLADLGFRPPEGWHRAAVCALSGHAPTPACDAQAHVHRPPNADALTPCPHHVRVAVDSRTGQPATIATPSALRDERTFVDLPNRYAAWMHQRGLRRPPYRQPAQVRIDVAPQVTILSPLDGTEVIRDPEAPDGITTLALRAAAPSDAQVLWMIDGAPVALSEAPHTLRWAVTPGVHTILASVALTDIEAAPVRIVVR